jgi:phage terminase large subunit GpA-like protein
LTADLVASRVNGLDRGVIPSDATALVAFCDVQGNSLWWTVCAFSPGFDCWVVDYGTFPDQSRPYFTLRDLKSTMATKWKGLGLEGQIHASLDAVAKDLIGRKWERQDGAMLPLDRLLIDGNWQQSTDTVYEFCRVHGGSVVMPCHGRYVGASGRPMNEWKRDRGERAGQNWRVSPARKGLRSVIFDANYWKTFVAARIFAQPGDSARLTLWGKDPSRHRMLADHASSEHRVRVQGRGRTMDEWKLKPGRDNHWWDGLVACAVAASVQGCALSAAAQARGTAQTANAPAVGPAAPRRAAAMSFSELQRAAKAARAR